MRKGLGCFRFRSHVTVVPTRVNQRTATRTTLLLRAFLVALLRLRQRISMGSMGIPTDSQTVGIASSPCRPLGVSKQEEGLMTSLTHSPGQSSVKIHHSYSPTSQSVPENIFFVKDDMKVTFVPPKDTGEKVLRNFSVGNVTWLSRTRKDTTNHTSSWP
jgi:hypothetical protein